MVTIQLDIDLSKVADDELAAKIKDAIETLRERKEAGNSGIPGFDDLVWDAGPTNERK